MVVKRSKKAEKEVGENLDKLLAGKLPVRELSKEVKLKSENKVARKLLEVGFKKEEIQKEILKKESAEQELEKLRENEINWLEDDYWNSWDKIKGHTKKLLGHGEELNGETKLFFLSHSKDIIRGKPQLIEQVQKKIPLIKIMIKKEIEGSGKDKIETMIKKIFIVGERVDVRYDGYLKDSMAMDFWLYKIVSDEGKEYYILTQQKLPNCTCNFKGMLIELDDFAEFSRSMKIKSLSRLFFMKEFKPDIKILTKEQLITYTKERKITEENWLNFLAYHRLGTYNRFPQETELLKSAFILSGKYDEWPLHLGFLGTTGTRKSMGLIETTAYKFSEEPLICEGANSRIKTLSPSFKEKPANIGYLAKQERIGFVDEIGKMVEFEINRHQTNMDNVLGDLNFLLDHKRRLVGSGNDNECEVQATAKFMMVTNPISNKSTIYHHVGLIDPTTMSRILWWVQDEAEQRFVLGEKGIIRVPPTPQQAYEGNFGGGVTHIHTSIRKIGWGSCSGVGGNIVENTYPSRDEFLTLFDSCYNFLCKFDTGEISKLVNVSVQLAKEPMKSSVWKPRAEHHIILLVDGLCKHRCLFKDYDSSFTAKQEEYDIAERILIRMIRGWDTNLSPKKEFDGF